MKLQKKAILISFALFALMQSNNSALAACSNANGLVLPVIDDNLSDSLTWQVPFNYYGHYYDTYKGLHPGEDWNLVGGEASADLGKPVYAIGDGEVVKISNLGTRGYNVVVKHTGNFRIPAKSGYYAEQTVNTLYSAYVHITNPIALNSCVQKGKTVIGKIINPGGGPHLHFEVAYRSSAVTNSTDWWPRDNGQGYYTTISNMVADGFKDPRSVISANQSATTKPVAPGSQSAKATSSSSITLSWSDLSNNESGFRPYRWNGSSWSSLGNVSANSTSYVNSGLSANMTYRYYVCSYNSAGESCPSTYVQATTNASGSSWDGKSPSGTVCEQDATTVASRNNSYGKIELRWSSACKTNWTRVVPNSSSYSTSGKIRRTSDQRSYTTSGTGTRFTEMVYAPNVQACASGSIKGVTLSEVCR